jgi:NDP-sugar pyrophosphorylase family protein
MLKYIIGILAINGQIKLKAITSGATESALRAKDLIDNDTPLVIYNCDQLINWDSKEFLDFVENKKPDAALVLYNSTDPKNSFADIKIKKITQVVEKQAISNHALIGFHYWAKGSDFVNSAERLIENFRLNGKPECYVSETFNYLINKRCYFIFCTFFNIAEYVHIKTSRKMAR